MRAQYAAGTSNRHTCSTMSYSSALHADVLGRRGQSVNGVVALWLTDRIP